MNTIDILPYTIDDNSAALALEDLCPQGKDIKLRFVRPSFHKRSEVYQKSRIVCAKFHGKLVGIAAGAEKILSFHGKTIRAVYGYDLRVHPDYRKYGTAKKLTDAVLEYFGNEIDCDYTYVGGQNQRALAHVSRGMGSCVKIPLTYHILPVHKPVKIKTDFEFNTISEVHSLYHEKNPAIEFITSLDPKQMIGYVNSITLNKKAGASVWSNEDILAEQVVSMPRRLKSFRLIQKALYPLIKLPKIPALGEIIKSWFLFDLFAIDDISLRQLLGTLNNFAFDNGKEFIYMLLQNNDPMADAIKRSGVRALSVPYVFIAKGRCHPDTKDSIYIDIRDL